MQTNTPYLTFKTESNGLRLFVILPSLVLISLLCLMVFDLCSNRFQVTKLINHTTTPVILLHLNLPPEERISTENILLAALIPGPNPHKSLDTFLRPLVEEIKDLGIGMPDTPHKFQPTFTIKAHLFLTAADGPALADLMGGKKPGN